MKKITGVQLLMVSIMALSTFTGFSQDKFGGLTLYTVRNEMDSNPVETLKAVADAGYKYIEAASYSDGKFYNLTPEEFKNHVEALGMIPLSTHQSTATLDNIDEEIAAVKAAGFKYFVIPVPPMGHFKYDPKTQSLSMSDDLELLAGILTTMGKKCKEAGLQLLYHNHNFEFEKNKNGIVPIEYFLENLDPEYVNFEIDLYWAVKAGADPVAYFNKYPGRFKIWHVKDMDDQGRFAPVGTGTIDFAKILQNKEVSGMQYYIVEQDQTFDGMKPLEAIQISHDGLKKFGFN
jgi:sugar phosphate isomerase/epimerase